MEEILRIVVEYVSIWAPSLVAILGVLSTVLVALAKTKDAFEKLNKDETLKTVKNQLSALVSEHEELREYFKLMMDEMTKIKNYTDNKKKGE